MNFVKVGNKMQFYTSKKIITLNLTKFKRAILMIASVIAIILIVIGALKLANDYTEFQLQKYEYLKQVQNVGY